MNPATSRRGSALIVTLITLSIAATLAYSAMSIATTHNADLERAERRMQARALAESGIQRGIRFLQSAMDRFPFDPYLGMDSVLTVDALGNPVPVTVANQETVVKNGRSYGSFTTSMVLQSTASGRDYVVTATGYVPGAASPLARATVQAVVHVDTNDSQAFDYSYFVNNWGWFYGDTRHSQGNVGSSGQFDVGGYMPTVDGAPRYGSSSGTDLIDYQDDNSDGLVDGSDGGIYSGWDVTNASAVQGMGGLAGNQHAFRDRVPMPNLSNLAGFEQKALAANGSISLGTTDAAGNLISTSPLTDAVIGDAAGEQQNLILVGTASQPIVLNGPVVVRGDVIIKGVVTGQGAILAGRNVYIADDVTYLNPPSSPLPATNSEADTEAWLQANAGADFLGLYAGEHVVLGDYTDSTWASSVGNWLASSMNQSAEDAGADHIPGTAAGKDGVAGTADDDLLEGDGQWTVEYYTQADANLGLIPPGFAVGDPIPGTGEDIDGDGQQDATTSLAEFNLNDPMDPAYWEGNYPAGAVQYSDVSSTVMTRVDGALYTNHTIAMVTLAASPLDFVFFGSVVCRNESLIYSTKSLILQHDRRLLAKTLLGSLLPTAPGAIRVVAWKNLEDGDVKVLVPTF